MTVHSEHPDHAHGEAIAAMYSHAASNPVAEWSYGHAEAYAAGVVFLLTVTAYNPILAAVIAFVIAGLMVGFGFVLSLREAHGNVERITAEVREREDR